MDLGQALRISRAARVAFTGAGGKTTAVFQLARALEPPVVVTCSAHLGAWQASLADRHGVVARPEDVERSAGLIEGVTLFTGGEQGDQRLLGLDTQSLAAVRDLADRLGFPVLIEADGSRQRPLKAPAEHEPVIPEWASQVVVVAGLSALGRSLEAGTVHRPEQFAGLGGIRLGDPITAESIARMLVHPQGGLKGIPAGARKIVLLNQADQPDLVDAGLRIANIAAPVYDSILVTALNEQKVWQVVEPVAGILLSGGGSSRLGQPKMLLTWRGKPLIRHVAEMALASGLERVVVVTGAVEQPIWEALAGLPVTFVHNAEWEQGQSTSLKAGIQALPANTGAALFLLSDQPFITQELLRGLVAQRQATLAPVVAPRVAGRRANPVLFGRETFASLLSLKGDTGGRAVLDQFPAEFVDWADQNLLLDVDTVDDYERLKGLE